MASGNDGENGDVPAFGKPTSESPHRENGCAGENDVAGENGVAGDTGVADLPAYMKTMQLYTALQSHGTVSAGLFFTRSHPSIPLISLLSLCRPCEPSSVPPSTTPSAHPSDLPPCSCAITLRMASCSSSSAFSLPSSPHCPPSLSHFPPASPPPLLFQSLHPLLSHLMVLAIPLTRTPPPAAAAATPAAGASAIGVGASGAGASATNAVSANGAVANGAVANGINANGAAGTWDRYSVRASSAVLCAPVLETWGAGSTGTDVNAAALPPPPPAAAPAAAAAAGTSNSGAAHNGTTGELHRMEAVDAAAAATNHSQHHHDQQQQHYHEHGSAHEQGSAESDISSLPRRMVLPMDVSGGPSSVLLLVIPPRRGVHSPSVNGLSSHQSQPQPHSHSQRPLANGFVPHVSKAPSVANGVSPFVDEPAFSAMFGHGASEPRIVFWGHLSTEPVAAEPGSAEPAQSSQLPNHQVIGAWFWRQRCINLRLGMVVDQPAHSAHSSSQRPTLFLQPLPHADQAGQEMSERLFVDVRPSPCQHCQQRGVFLQGRVLLPAQPCGDGTVLFHFWFGHGSQRKSQAVRRSRCPICRTACGTTKGLRNHLEASHSRFDYTFHLQQPLPVVHVTCKPQLDLERPAVTASASVHRQQAKGLPFF
ncbi:unnamed protein product, partial [Closterium sp. NIES-54]